MTGREGRGAGRHGERMGQGVGGRSETRGGGHLDQQSHRGSGETDPESTKPLRRTECWTGQRWRRAGPEVLSGTGGKLQSAWTHPGYRSPGRRRGSDPGRDGDFLELERKWGRVQTPAHHLQGWGRMGRRGGQPLGSRHTRAHTYTCGHTHMHTHTHAHDTYTHTRTCPHTTHMHMHTHTCARI